MNNPKRGGLRNPPGGRPPKTGEKLVPYATRLLPEQVEFLKTLPNAAEWLREAIEEKRQ